MKIGDLQKGDLVYFEGLMAEWGVVCSFVPYDHSWMVVHGRTLGDFQVFCMFSGYTKDSITQEDVLVFRGGKQIHPLPKVGKIGPQNENL